jgi:hypothetical protein
MKPLKTPAAILDECKAKFADAFKEPSSQSGAYGADEVHLLEALVAFQCGSTKSMIHLTLLEVSDMILVYFLRVS